MSSTLRKWFVAGLMVWLPLAATLLVIRFLVGVLDTSLLLLPPDWRPTIPGVGVVLSVALVLITGALVANYIGSHLLRWLEALLARIPLVSSMYGGLKKVAETLFSESSKAFRQPVLVEYPRKGLWSLGFITGEPRGEIPEGVGHRVFTVFIPTTPNPTSGFIIMVPEPDAIPLTMSVEEAMRLIISLGVVTPDGRIPPPRSDAV